MKKILKCIYIEKKIKNSGPENLNEQSASVIALPL